MLDLEAARKAGYGDDVIARALAQEQGVDFDAALKAGYSPSDMLPSLMDGAQDKGFFAKAGDFISDALSDEPSIADKAGAYSAKSQERAGKLAPLSEAGYNKIASGAVESPQDGGIISRAAETASTDEGKQAELNAVDDVFARAQAEKKAEQDSFKEFNRENPNVAAFGSGTRSLASSIADIPQLSNDLIKQVAIDPFRHLFGKESLPPTARFQIAKDFEQAGKDYMPEIAKRSLSELKDYKEIGSWIAAQAAMQSPQIVASTGAALIPKLRAAYLSLMGLSSGASNYQENLEKGVNQNTAMKGAAVNAAAEIIGESLGFGAFDYVGKYIKNLPLPQRHAVVADALKKTMLVVGAGVAQQASEGIGEGVTQIGQNASERYVIGDKSVGLMDRVPEAVAIGAIMGTPTAIAQSYRTAQNPSDILDKSKTISESIDTAASILDESLDVRSAGLMAAEPIQTQPIPPQDTALTPVTTIEEVQNGPTITPAAGPVDTGSLAGERDNYSGIDASAILGDDILGDGAEGRGNTQEPVASTGQNQPVSDGGDAAVAFADPHEERVSRHFEKAGKAGISREHAEVMAPEQDLDHVTGFYRGEEKGPTLKRAQEYVEKTGQAAHYVDADIANLGGINAHFENNADVANQFYRGMADIFREEMEKAGSRAVMIRQGGDEISAVVIGGNSKSVAKAMAAVHKRTQEYAGENGLGEIPYGKRKDDKTPYGTGIYMGAAQIEPRKQLEEMFKKASVTLNKAKEKGLKNVTYSENEALGTGSPDQQTRRAETGADGTGAGTGREDGQGSPGMGQKQPGLAAQEGSIPQGAGEKTSAAVIPVSKKRASNKVNTLLTAVRDMGGLSLNSKRDVAGEKMAPGGYNQLFRADAKNTLEGLAGKGELDEFLPYELRFATNDKAGAEVADMQDAVEWIKDRIRSGERIIPYDAQMELDQREIEAQALIDAVEEELSYDEINAQLQLATDAEREDATNARIFNPGNEESGTERSAGTETGKGASTEAGAKEQAFQLKSQTNAEIAAKEALAQDTTAEDKAAADRAAEVPLTLTAQSQEKTTGPTAQAGMFTPDGRATVAAEAKPEMKRGEAGALLSKEERKAVLKTLTDVYRTNKVPKEQKGVDRNGNEYFGYVHSPEYFVKSDITGAMVRYHVTLPDGRIAHPTELFADYTQSNIDEVMQKQIDADNIQEQHDKYRLETLQRRTADTINDANRKFNSENKGRLDYVPAVLTDGKQFIRTPEEMVERDLALLGEGWRQQKPEQAEQKPTPEAAKAAFFAQPTSEATKAKKIEVLKEQAKGKITGDQGAALKELAEAGEHAAVDAVLRSEVKTAGTEAAQEAAPEAEPRAEQIDDLGEKIGGARKDTAVSRGGRTTKESTETSESEPSWRKRFTATQLTEQVDQPWYVTDNKTKRFVRGDGYRNAQYSSKEAAESAIPLIAVAQKHHVVMTSRGDETPVYEIKRYVTDRKRITVVPEEFANRDDAMRYMAEHAAEILETKTSFGEEILPKPETVQRIGAVRREGDVGGKDFMDTFGFRGVEFGNWNNQEERQDVLNHAYDGLLDLAEVLNIPAKAISLNGDLALAFGARGQGLVGARAHYERHRAVINLTKMSGAGALAHEWLHGFDHYLGRLDGKAKSEMKAGADGHKTYDETTQSDYASHGFSYNSKMREELQAAYKELIETMFYKAEKYVEDTQKAEDWLGRSRDALQSKLDNIRRNLAEQLNPEYYKRNNKPASAEQLAQFDELASKLIEGQDLGVRAYFDEKKKVAGRLNTSMRMSNETLEAMNVIIKDVRGRSGFNAAREGWLDGMRSPMSNYQDRIKMLEEARTEKEKTKRVPTEYRRDATEIDQGRASDYWATEHEMAARAFSAYVEDRLDEKGSRSDFLSFGSKGRIPTAFGWVRPFPAGDERVAINKAFDKFFETIQTKETDKGTALYEPKRAYNENQFDLFADPYDTLETRPGTTDAQLDAGRDALAAVERRIFGRDSAALPVRASVLGSAISSDFRTKGYTSLVGRQVNTSGDLALVAQVLRDPRFETFRAFYVKDGKIVGERAYSSRMVGQVSLSPEIAEHIGTDMQRTEADGYWLLHNHPSGRATASQSDLRLTEMIAGNARGMLGHVIIDHNEYNSIEVFSKGVAGLSAVEEVIRTDLGAMAAQPEVAHALLGREINSPKEAAAIAKHLQQDGVYSSIIGRDAKGDVTMVLDVPALADQNAMNRLRAAALIRRAARETGSLDVFAVVPGDLKDYDHLMKRDGIFRDVISTDTGESAVERGMMFSNGIGGTKVQQRGMLTYVAENAPEYSRAQQEKIPLQGGETGNSASWDAPGETFLDNVVYKLQNKNIDLKRVIEAVKATGTELADKYNAYLQEELFHGRAAKRTQDFVNTEMRPLLDDMRMRGLTIEQLDEYLHARHAKEANALIAERAPDMPDGGSGMTDQQADDYMEGLSDSQKTRLEAVAKRVDAILAKTRDLYTSYGLVSKNETDAWGKMFEHYVPLMREDHDGGMGVGQGFSVKGKEVKHRTGSTAKVVDILANIALQREKAITRGEKNRVAVSLAGLVKLNPNPDFWKFGPISERRYNETTGMVEFQVNGSWKNKDHVIIAKISDGKGNVVERGVIFNESNDRAMRMAESLKNLDATQLGGLMGASAHVTRYFASVNTQYNPVFGITNIVRDVQGMALNLDNTALAKHKLDVIKAIPAMLKGIYQDARMERKGRANDSETSKLWEELQDEGGMTGYRDLYRNSEDRANAIKHELDPHNWVNNKWGKVFTAGGMLKVPLTKAQDVAGPIFNWLSDYNQTLEGATRLATYKVALDNGFSKQQAASLAKNITVNFNRKGQIGQQAGALYAFFNAAMQGTARIGQTIFAMDKGDIKTLRLNKTGKAIVYGGMLLGVMQAVALAAAGFDDDEPPEFVRERSLIFPIGNKKYVSLPMPLGYHVLPNIGRIATEFAMNGFKKPTDHVIKLAGIFVEAFNPIGSAGLSMQTIAPTPLDPFAALAENKDWTGKHIAKPRFDTVTPGFSHNKDTATTLSKLIAEAFNTLSGGDKYTAGAFSPTADQLDYLAGQVGGGVWREGAKLEQAVVSTVTGEELPTYKIPLVGRFYGDGDSKAGQGGAYYSNLQRVKEVEAGLKGRLEDDLPVDQFKRDNPEYRLIGRAKLAESTLRSLQNRKREMIEHSVPREKIKLVEERITQVMKQFNESASKLEAP